LACSENPGNAGGLARILLKNAGEPPAFPAKNGVFGACPFAIKFPDDPL